MDINRINNIVSNSIGEEKKPANKTNNNNLPQANTPKEQEIKISPQSKQLNQIVKTLENTPSVDQDKVALIKQKIAEGTYPILQANNTDAFENLAKNIIEFESELDKP
jgi:negative regulator of flagellin synthesis FlgM